MTFNPASLSIPAGGTSSSIATVSGNSTATPASYLVDVSILNGGLLGSFNSTVTPGPATVPDFRLSTNVTSVAPPAGRAAFVQVSVLSLAGFSGDVTLQLASGTGAWTLNTTVVHLSPGSIVNATLRIPPGCAMGIYGQLLVPTVPSGSQIIGMSGSRFHWLGLTTGLASSPPTFCFRSDTNPIGITIGSSGGMLLIFGWSAGLVGAVQMSSQSGFPTVFFPSQTVSLGANGIGTVDRPLSPVPMYVTVPADTVPGNYTVTVKGTMGSVSWTLNQTIEAIKMPYFTMDVEPSSLQISPGSLGRLTISLTGQMGFSDSVNVVVQDPNRTFTFSQQPVGYNLQVTEGHTAQLTLTVNATNGPPAGHYEILVAAGSFRVEQRVIIPVAVGNSPVSTPASYLPVVIGGIGVVIVAAAAGILLVRRSRKNRLSPRVQA